MPSAMLVWHENARLESCHLGDHDRRTMGIVHIPRQPAAPFPTSPSRLGV